MALEFAPGTMDDRSVVIGANTYIEQIDTVAASLAAAGWTVTNLGQFSIFRSNSTATNAANGNTVTINARVYTFRTTLTGVPDEILIGASAASTLFNFYSAINGLAGAGTLYGTGTAVNAHVTAIIPVLNGDSTPGSNGQAHVFVHTKGPTGLVVSASGNLTWSGSPLANTLYRCASQETVSYGRVVMYMGAQPTANQLNVAIMRRLERGTLSGIGFFDRTNSIGTGDTFRVLSHAYGFHCFEVGLYNNNGAGWGAQVFAIPDFMRPKRITGATNTAPIQITTSAAHGYSTGDQVKIAYVEGNLAANGTFTITVTGTTTFTLNGSAGSGAFSGTRGLSANQTPPRTEVLELCWLNVGTSGAPGWTADLTRYFATTSSGTALIFDESLKFSGTDTIGTFVQPRSTDSNLVRWYCNAGFGVEPLAQFTNLFGANLRRVPGQLYNAFFCTENTAGGASVSAAGHTWYGAYNNDPLGQLFLMTS